MTDTTQEISQEAARAMLAVLRRLTMRFEMRGTSRRHIWKNEISDVEIGGIVTDAFAAIAAAEGRAP